MARVTAFQARGRGFESRFPLHAVSPFDGQIIGGIGVRGCVRIHAIPEPWRSRVLAGHPMLDVGYFVERNGMTGIRQMLRWMGEGRPFPQAFQETFQMDVDALQQNLRDLLVRGLLMPENRQPT